jgi:hypothetical protein
MSRSTENRPSSPGPDKVSVVCVGVSANVSVYTESLRRWAAVDMTCAVELGDFRPLYETVYEMSTYVEVSEVRLMKLQSLKCGVLRLGCRCMLLRSDDVSLCSLLYELVLHKRPALVTPPDASSAASSSPLIRTSPPPECQVPTACTFSELLVSYHRSPSILKISYPKRPPPYLHQLLSTQSFHSHLA